MVHVKWINVCDVVDDDDEKNMNFIVQSQEKYTYTLTD